MEDLIYRVDIDNTICETSGIDYKNSKPLSSRISRVNELYDAGHCIVVETGRHWRNLKLTVKQLKSWGLKYHALCMGVAPANLLNDRSIEINNFFKEK